ncbi:hypothetical protein Scep_017087 [Stephania cephalantha]|uniref:Uncharacterized protein n=1 Tax=Stephania cephalantha TaxID=152367 RepID=A0AAP0INT0_9MAGN
MMAVGNDDRRWISSGTRRRVKPAVVGAIVTVKEVEDVNIFVCIGIKDEGNYVFLFIKYFKLLVKGF